LGRRGSAALPDEMSAGRLSSFAQGFGGLGFAPVRGDDGNDRSFITRDFNRGLRKENGTIPFYGRFLKKVFIRKFRELTRITKEESRKAAPWFQK
jgi:hypothetical protein